jgi:multiple sugar transport system permease protein
LAAKRWPICVDWLGNPTLAFWSMVFIDVWQQMSFVVLILARGWRRF